VDAPHLDGLRVNAVQTAENGVIGADTFFDFHQEAERVWATYAGSRIEREYLVGTVRGHAFELRYSQMQSDGTLDCGHSDCELERSEEGLVRSVEHFEWASRPGGGINVIQEVREVAG
jgi:hypothetical protein